MANLAGNGPVPVGSTKSANRFGVVRPRGERARVDLERQRRRPRAVHPRRRLERPGLRASSTPTRSRRSTARRRTGSAASACSSRSRTWPRCERAIDRPHRDFLAEKPVPGRGLRPVPAPVRLRQDAARRPDRGGEAGLVRRPPEDHVQRGLRRRADDGLPVPARRRAQPPYQVVVYFPGSGAISTRSSEALELGRVDFLVKSGRAVAVPDLQGDLRARRRPELGLRRGDGRLQGLRDHVGQGPRPARSTTSRRARTSTPAASPTTA